MADACPSIEDDRIHGTHGTSAVGQSGQEGHHRLLARVRDVHAGKPHSLGRGEQLGEGLVGQTETREIDQLIDAAQAAPSGLLDVHSRRPRGLNIGADQAQEQVFHVRANSSGRVDPRQR